jgi:hypothetical protein
LLSLCSGARYVETEAITGIKSNTYQPDILSAKSRPRIGMTREWQRI